MHKVFKLLYYNKVFVIFVARTSLTKEVVRVLKQVYVKRKYEQAICIKVSITKRLANLYITYEILNLCKNVEMFVHK